MDLFLPYLIGLLLILVGGVVVIAFAMAPSKKARKQRSEMKRSHGKRKKPERKV